MKIIITYLDNSGFLVETQNYNLIFDYYNIKPSRDGRGVIIPEKLPRKDTLVFVSHSHYDHYNPSIFERLKKVEDITYVFSNDIRTNKNVIRVAPDKSYNIKGVRVNTFKSTDEGVAFLIGVDGAAIYHAGDLNWWDWQGEPKKWLSDMERDYKKEILKLKDIRINLAFAPIDPRLEHNMGKGARFLIDTANIDLLIPMHYRGEIKAAREFIRRNFAHENKTFVSKPLSRGESLVYSAESKNGGHEFSVKHFID